MCNPWLFKTITYIWLHYWWPKYFPITESVFHQTPVFAPYVRVNHVHVYQYNRRLLIFILGIFFSGRECCCSCQTATSFWTSSSRTLTQHRLVITPCTSSIHPLHSTSPLILLLSFESLLFTLFCPSFQTWYSWPYTTDLPMDSQSVCLSGFLIHLWMRMGRASWWWFPYHQIHIHVS